MSKNTNKPKCQSDPESKKPTILVERFELETPRLYTKSPQKPNSADDWQHQLSSKPTKTLTFDTNSTTQYSQQSTLETSPEELYELFQDAPDNYFTKQPTHPETDPNLEIHHESPIKNHVTIKTSCDGQKQPLLNEDLSEHIQFVSERNLSYLPISTSLTLKRKRHMYYIPMDFEKLTLDGLIDTGALTSAISEQDLNKIKLLANEAIKETGPHQTFKLWWPMDNWKSRLVLFYLNLKWPTSC